MTWTDEDRNKGLDYDILEQMVESDRRPRGGDAVRLAAPWKWGLLPAGKVGVIQGCADVDMDPTEWHSIMFNCSNFRGRQCEPTGSVHTAHWEKYPIYVSSSGGPGTIFTPMWELMPTNERVWLNCWRWKDTPRAHSGVNFKIEVPVWLWIPSN